MLKLQKRNTGKSLHINKSLQLISNMEGEIMFHVYHDRYHPGSDKYQPNHSA